MNLQTALQCFVGGYGFAHWYIVGFTLVGHLSHPHFFKSFTPALFLSSLPWVSCSRGLFLYLFLSPFPLSCLIFLCLPLSFLTPKILSVLTGEAAGETGWLECPAAAMLKEVERKKEKNTHIHTPVNFPSRGFCQVLWFPRETFVLKWNRIPSRERICSKTALNCQLHFW